MQTSKEQSKPTMLAGKIKDGSTSLTAGGILIVNKPVGPTSHDIVDMVRRATGERTVGHAGTLDPFAEGVLILLVGRAATKRQAEFMHMPKQYRAVVHLGASSDTDDVMGKITEQKNSETIEQKKIEDVLKKFVGDIEQMPPAYSAIKLKGKKAYELARQGKTPELKARMVRIEKITLLGYEWPELEIEVDCAAGTYIRALARDIGQALGCGAYLTKLVRTRIGQYTLENATKL